MYTALSFSIHLLLNEPYEKKTVVANEHFYRKLLKIISRQIFYFLTSTRVYHQPFKGQYVPTGCLFHKLTVPQQILNIYGKHERYAPIKYL